MIHHDDFSIKKKLKKIRQKLENSALLKKFSYFHGNNLDLDPFFSKCGSGFNGS